MMANNQEMGNEYFNYVEKRIDKLEELILKKDEELKALILKATGNNGLHRNEDDVLVKKQEEFDQVFKDIKKEEEIFLEEVDKKTAYKTEDLNRQLSNIEQREKLVKGMLNSLETALSILKQRHEEVNRKEETLDLEYQRLQEMEELYQKIEKMETQSSQDRLGNFETKTPDKLSYKE